MKRGTLGLWRKALFLLSGNSATALLTLARNLLVARMLPVADYGIAATFAITMAVVEMASALGLQQQIIQAKDGDDPRFQAALQGFQVLRGTLSGLLMLALAVPFAGFMNIPEAAWGYAVLALVPVLNALQHFDIHRLTRQDRFTPMILTGVIPAVLALAAVWPLAAWYGDWRVMLWSLVLQAVLAVVVSHLAAERRYRLIFDRTEMLRSFHFGWPLLLNSVLMFLVFNGDKLIVGRVLGMEALAIFAMGVTLTLTPTLVMAKTVQNIFLPRLSGASDRSDKFDVIAGLTIEASLLNGFAMIVATMLLGPSVVLIILGPSYAELLDILTILSILCAVRIFKAGPGTVALSLGITTTTPLANIPRVVTLPIVYLLLEGGFPIYSALLVGVIAETLGYFIAFRRIQGRDGISLKQIFLPMIAIAGIAINDVAHHVLPIRNQDLYLYVNLVCVVMFLASLRQTWTVIAGRSRH